MTTSLIRAGLIDQPAPTWVMVMSPPEINDSDNPQSYKDARTFRDAHGVLWFVHEVGGEALGGGPPCLLLVSARQVRRVFGFPTDWRHAPAEALLELPYSSL